MAPKPGNYAVLEAIQHEMRNDPYMTMLYEYQRPTAISPMGTVIDLHKEFGAPRSRTGGRSTRSGSSAAAPASP